MNEFQPSRRQTDLAEVVEMLLDKGVVINADIAVSIGDTQLLGIQLRAAIASFETAAKYGLEFPEGTDMRRVAEAAGDPELAERDRPAVPIDPTRGVNVSAEDGEGEGGDEDGARSEDEDEDEDEPDGAEGDDEDEADPDAASDGGSSGVGHLGARPDPRTSTGTGRNLVHDTTQGDPTEWDPNAGTGGGAETDGEDEGGNAEDEDGHTEGDDGDD